MNYRKAAARGNYFGSSPDSFGELAIARRNGGLPVEKLLPLAEGRGRGARGEGRSAVTARVPRGMAMIQ